MIEYLRWGDILNDKGLQCQWTKFMSTLNE